MKRKQHTVHIHELDSIRLLNAMAYEVANAHGVLVCDLCGMSRLKPHRLAEPRAALARRFRNEIVYRTVNGERQYRHIDNAHGVEWQQMSLPDIAEAMSATNHTSILLRMRYAERVCDGRMRAERNSSLCGA